MCVYEQGGLEQYKGQVSECESTLSGYKSIALQISILLGEPFYNTGNQHLSRKCIVSFEYEELYNGK